MDFLNVMEMEFNKNNDYFFFIDICVYSLLCIK